MQRNWVPGSVLAVLVLAASLGAALPQPPGGVAVWAAPVGPGEAAGFAWGPLGLGFLAGTRDGDLVLTSVDALGAAGWEVVLGDAFAGDVAAMPDGGAVVAGHVPGMGADALVAAVDRDGGLRWQRTVATPEADYFRAVAATSGAVYAAGSTGGDVLVARFDHDGRHRWSSRVGGSADEVAEALVVTAHGPLAVGWSHDGARNRVVLHQLDAFGHLLWQRTFTWQGASVRGLAAAQTPLGDVLVAGVHATRDREVPLLLRFDSIGGLEWFRTYDTVQGGAARALALDAAGSAVVAGDVAGPEGERRLLLMRLTPGGEAAWTRQGEPSETSSAAGLAWLPSGLLGVGAQAGGQRAVLAYLDPPVRTG